MKKTIVFIIGAGHSGSTLLAKSLNAHSRIFSLSEISNFEEDIKRDFSLCGCSSPIKECPFWEQVNADLANILGYGIKDRPREFNLRINKHSILDKLVHRAERTLAYGLNIRSRFFRSRLKNIRRLFETLFDLTQADVLVDSSKSAKRAYLLKKYFHPEYNIRVIHLVRDGRAVFYSYAKGYYRVNITDPETGKQEMKTYYSDRKRTKQEILKIWKKANKTAFKYHQTNGKNKDYFFLRYEDFTNQPEKYLKDLLQFVGLEYEPEMLDLNRYVNHMVSGNASRINASEIHAPSEIWKKKLNGSERDYFSKKGQKFNHKLGYSG